MKTTHTFALLELSPAAFEEIASKLREAGYGHAFTEHADGRAVIDMHGIAVLPLPPQVLAAPAPEPASSHAGRRTCVCLDPEPSPITGRCGRCGGE